MCVPENPPSGREGEPAAKRIRVVVQEVQEQVEENPIELEEDHEQVEEDPIDLEEDFEQVDEDLIEFEEDHEPESLSDTDYEDLSSEDEEGEVQKLVVVAPDAEDVIPAVDIDAMDALYDRVHRTAITIRPHRAFSKGSSRSAGSVLRYGGINIVTVEVTTLWTRFEKMINDERQNRIWPVVYHAAMELNMSGRLQRSNNLENCVVPLEFGECYEKAVAYLMNRPRPTGPVDTVEEKQARIRYEVARVRLLQRKAVKYHKFNGTRPGWEHKYGHMFPVQTSYEMIEYLKYGLLFEVNLEYASKHNQVWHPEFDEISTIGRQLIEKCFVLDPRFHQKHLEMTQALVENMDEDEEELVISIIDEMTTLFSLDFEHFIIDEADTLKERRERANRRQQERALTETPADGIDQSLLINNADEVHRNFQERYINRYMNN